MRLADIDSPDNTSHAIQYRIIYALVMISFQLWWISIYLHGILRLISVFEDKQHLVVSRWRIILYVLCLLFTIIIEDALFILERISTINLSISTTRYCQVGASVPIALCAISLFYQFNSKLFKLLVERTQMRILSAATKHTILSTFVVLLMFIHLVYYGTLYGKYDEISSPHSTYHGYNQVFLCTMLDLGLIIPPTIILYLIYLANSFNESKYLYCCNWCDRKLKAKYHELQIDLEIDHVSSTKTSTKTRTDSMEITF